MGIGRSLSVTTNTHHNTRLARSQASWTFCGASILLANVLLWGKHPACNVPGWVGNTSRPVSTNPGNAKSGEFGYIRWGLMINCILVTLDDSAAMEAASITS